MAKRLRHETDHAYQMAQYRRIQKEERQKVLRTPDRVEVQGDKRLHYDTTTRSKVCIVAVLAIGFGTAILTKNPIAGLGAGTFCSIVTYYLQRK